MRVLVVTNMYPVPEALSAGLFVEREVKGLRDREGIEVAVEHVRTTERKVRYLTGRRSVAQAVRRFRPDLLHIHYGLTQVVTLGFQVPRVCTFHGSDLNIAWQRAISRAAASQLDAAIVVSEPLARNLPPSVMCEVIPCGVDQAFRELDVTTARHELGFPRDALILGFPGSPSKKVKRFDRFREVSARVSAATDAQVHEAVLEDIAPSRVPHWLNSLDCLVVTSDCEGSPVVTKEALCCGVRVVATPVGDLRRQLAGFSGCAVADGFDADLIAAAVMRALRSDSPDAGQARGAFGLEREVESVRRVYERILGAS